MYDGVSIRVKSSRWYVLSAFVLLYLYSSVQSIPTPMYIRLFFRTSFDLHGEYEICCDVGEGRISRGPFVYVDKR